MQKINKKHITIKVIMNIIYSTLILTIYFGIFQIPVIEQFDLTHQVLTTVISIIFMLGVLTYMANNINKYMKIDTYSNPFFFWC